MSKVYTYRPITPNGLIQFSEIIDGYLTPWSRSGGMSGVVDWNPGSNTLDPRVGRSVHCEQWLVFSARSDLRFRVSVDMADYREFAEWLGRVGQRAIQRNDDRFADLGYQTADRASSNPTPEIAALYEMGHQGIDVALAGRRKRMYWQRRIGHHAWLPWPLANVELVPWAKPEPRPRGKAKQ